MYTTPLSPPWPTSGARSMMSQMRFSRMIPDMSRHSIVPVRSTSGAPSTVRGSRSSITSLSSQNTRWNDDDTSACSLRWKKHRYSRRSGPKYAVYAASVSSK